MKKLRYALAHGGVLTLILLIAVSVISVTVFGWKKQVRSAKDGIEVLLVDTVITPGSNSFLEDEIEDVTGIVAGVATLDSSDAAQYIKTISDYTMNDYITYLCRAKNTEILIVPASFLEDALLLEMLVPLEIDIPQKREECFVSGVAYALPIKDLPLTPSGACAESLSRGETYALLLSGDSTDDAREYLKKVFAGEI